MHSVPVHGIPSIWLNFIIGGGYGIDTQSPRLRRCSASFAEAPTRFGIASLVVFGQFANST